MFIEHYVFDSSAKEMNLKFRIALVSETDIYFSVQVSKFHSESQIVIIQMSRYNFLKLRDYFNVSI